MFRNIHYAQKLSLDASQLLEKNWKTLVRWQQDKLSWTIAKYLRKTSNTPHARFFPVPNQTTPTWCEKLQALENIGRQMPDAIMPFTVKYLHALDALYEDQHRELMRWVTKTRDTEAEVRALQLELEEAHKQMAIITDKMEFYRRELKETLERTRYKNPSRKMTKKRTFAIPTNRRIEIPGLPRVSRGNESYRH